jgi:hypothetical protein
LTISYQIFTSQTQLIDSPFVKMARYSNTGESVLGTPPIPTNGEIPTSNLYEKAARVLDLNSEDSNFVALRIRHLDFAARQSLLADSITWKSSTAEAWNLAPIFDKPTGVEINVSSPLVKLTPINRFVSNSTRLNWNYVLTATGAQFSIQNDKGVTQSFQINAQQTLTVPLENSGYSLFIQNFLTGAQTATATINITWPYIGNLVPIKNRIVEATDLLMQLSVSYADIFKYCQPYSAPEDVIAAFLIGLDAV